MNKKKIIILNWKLNGLKDNIKCFIEKFLLFINNNLNKINNIDIILSPPIIYIDYINYLLRKSNIIKLCSQNLDLNYFGSFTGEISVLMLKDLNIKYSIVGHSERIKFHNENINIISEKFYILKINNIIPILCIGYNNDILCQIKYIINKYGIKILYNTIIAYEPLNSIGTGITPSLEYINNNISIILNYLLCIDKNIKSKINIIYGGSVSYKNSNNIIFNTNINGLLIGNSSIKIYDIIKIINNLL